MKNKKLEYERDLILAAMLKNAEERSKYLAIQSTGTQISHNELKKMGDLFDEDIRLLTKFKQITKEIHESKL